MAVVLVLPTLAVFAFLALSNLELRASADYQASFTDTKLRTKHAGRSDAALADIAKDIQSYACNYVDCSAIYRGGPCFNPSKDLSHAAFAMNAYHQEQHDCFSGSEIISITDPSYGNCYFNTWCVAKPTTTDSLLQLNIDFACSKVNCSVIEPGGQCQLPDTIIKHSSVAMNLYYQSFGRTDLNCYFQSTRMLVIEDPSSGTCVYEGVVPVTNAVPAHLKMKKGESSWFVRHAHRWWNFPCTHCQSHCIHSQSHQLPHFLIRFTCCTYYIV